MFGVFGGSASIFAGRRDPTKEKAAPPLPTPVCFPTVTNDGPGGPTDRLPAFKEIAKRVMGVRKPPDLCTDILHSINLEPAIFVQSDSLVPAYEQQSGAKLLNGRAAPSQDDFGSRRKEIALPNETGYAILAGKMRGDKSAPRLMQYRRFWEGLDSMANYWDTSLDEYIINGEVYDSPVSPNSTPPPSPSKRQRMSLADQEPQSSVESEEINEEKLLQGRYRGHRMSNGASMPEQHRLDTVRGFLEPVTWPFGFSIQPPRKGTILCIGNVRIPVRLSYTVWRIPKEREKAQGRWVEGPVIGVDCRPGTGYQPDGVSSRVDIVGEITALLALAQERAREGKFEIKSGEGKWWTTNPRWGGGEGGQEVDCKMDESLVPGKDDTERTSSNPGARSAARKLETRRATMHTIWKTLKPSAGYWDPKADYQRIGRSQNTGTDQVYLVSSLNHHLSLLKLEVHPCYLQALTTGDLPDEIPSDPSWHKPRLSRSKWFDLFSPDDRLEAMELVWKLMGYMSRVELPNDIHMA